MRLPIIETEVHRLSMYARRDSTHSAAQSDGYQISRHPRGCSDVCPPSSAADCHARRNTSILARAKHPDVIVEVGLEHYYAGSAFSRLVIRAKSWSSTSMCSTTGSTSTVPFA